MVSTLTISKLGGRGRKGDEDIVDQDSGLVTALVCGRSFQSTTLLQINSSFHHQKRGRVALAARPDVALLDIEMPGGSGLEAAQALQQALPTCRSVILTTFGRSGYLRRAMWSGAVGFLLKDAPASELAITLRRVMAGERVVDPDLALAALSEGSNPLTPRERDVLSASLFGASLAEIAAQLVLSEGTVVLQKCWRSGRLCCIQEQPRSSLHEPAESV